MRVAVVGAGISGLSCAWLLAREHDVELFEADARLGGHAHSHEVEAGGRRWVLDTGFLVYNERTYPNFTRLLAALGVEGRPSDMSFSVRCRRCGLEWGSRSLRALFAQPWRVADPGHLRLLADMLRFFRDARACLGSDAGYEVTVAEFLARGRYGAGLSRHFLLPMVGAIWSASAHDMRAFPARSLLQFLDNHGLLAPSGAPPWRTVAGGSRAYVRAMAAALGGRVHTGAPVRHVSRDGAGVELVSDGAGGRRFDRVVIATHADQALAILADPSPEEGDALGRFRYSANHAVLHTDASALPSNRAAWASWNCDLADCRDESAPAAVTYHLNRLQGLTGGPDFCVSLNRAAAPAGGALAEMTYAHPILDRPAVEAQAAVRRLNGSRHTYYCGAHLRHGFHEDGLVSALEVATHFGVSL